MTLRPIRQWESAIDRQIREAHERGEFDALPGAGKPLRIESWDDDMALARHVLRQAGETLPWIALGRDIEAAQARLSQMLAHAAQLPRGPGFRTERARALARYLDAASELDRMLQDYAFSVPVRSLERGRLPPHIAAQRFDAACPP